MLFELDASEKSKYNDWLLIDFLNGLMDGDKEDTNCRCCVTEKDAKHIASELGMSYRPSLNRILEAGVLVKIKNERGKYTITARGRALVDMIYGKLTSH